MDYIVLKSVSKPRILEQEASERLRRMSRKCLFTLFALFGLNKMHIIQICSFLGGLDKTGTPMDYSLLVGLRHRLRLIMT